MSYRCRECGRVFEPSLAEKEMGRVLCGHCPGTCDPVGSEIDGQDAVRKRKQEEERDASLADLRRYLEQLPDETD